MSRNIDRYQELIMTNALELQKRGYVEFSNDNTEFWLTEAGYRRAEQGWVQRVVGYFNKNPGLSVPIALCTDPD
jgi:hypothetical protein